MKKWLIERFLPVWAKETVLKQCRLLQAENEKLHHQNRELRAYIRGMQAGTRRRKQEGQHEHTSV